MEDNMKNIRLKYKLDAYFILLTAICLFVFLCFSTITILGCGPVSFGQGQVPSVIEPSTPSFIDSLPAETRIDSLPQVDVQTVTRADVRAIWDKACDRYGVQYVYYKRIGKDALVVAEQLSNVFGVPSAEDLLKTRYITIVFGDTKIISTAHEIGIEGDQQYQLETLAHELQHSIELSVTRYVLDKKYRADIEGRGEASGSDPRQLFGKPDVPPASVFGARWRRAYKLSTKYERKAAETYTKLTERHERGLFATRVGADVARIISERMGTK